MRASDAEREHAADELRRHHLDGRITSPELADRLRVAYDARTHADLDLVLADLPHAQATEPDERTWATLAHLSALSCVVCVPLGQLAGPLAVYLLKRKTSEYVDEHARAALNFNVSMSLYAIVGLLMLVTSFRARLPGMFLMMLLVALWSFSFWLGATVVGAMKAARGERYRYPLTLPFLR
jgi:uncharacterized Tic20 family protein